MSVCVCVCVCVRVCMCIYLLSNRAAIQVHVVVITGCLVGYQQISYIHQTGQHLSGVICTCTCTCTCVCVNFVVCMRK